MGYNKKKENFKADMNTFLASICEIDTKIFLLTYDTRKISIRTTNNNEKKEKEKESLFFLLFTRRHLVEDCLSTDENSVVLSFREKQIMDWTGLD